MRIIFTMPACSRRKRRSRYGTRSTPTRGFWTQATLQMIEVSAMDLDKKYRRVMEGERAVVFFDDCAWIAQGIDHEIASQGASPEDAIDAFVVHVRFWTSTPEGL